MLHREQHRTQSANNPESSADPLQSLERVARQRRRGCNVARFAQPNQTAPSMGTLKYGIFDWVDVNGEMPVNHLFEQRLRMLEYADEAGFFCYHVAEHHGTPLSMVPSPNLLLTAVAQRTRQLHIGPMVSILRSEEHT